MKFYVNQAVKGIGLIYPDPMVKIRKEKNFKTKEK